MTLLIFKIYSSVAVQLLFYDDSVPFINNNFILSPQRHTCASLIKECNDLLVRKGIKRFIILLIPPGVVSVVVAVVVLNIVVKAVVRTGKRKNVLQRT